MERKPIRSLCPIMPASRSRGLVYNVICCARLSGGLTGSVSGFLIVFLAACCCSCSIEGAAADVLRPVFLHAGDVNFRL